VAPQLRTLGTLRVLAGQVVSPKKDGSIESWNNACISIRDGEIDTISEVGNSMDSITKSGTSEDPVLDRRKFLITPGFVDSHTHLFPPTDRSAEFVQRPFKSYQEIAAAGGGILSTVKSFRESSIEDIVEVNRPIFQQFFAQGTTTVEVKSGYGLTTHDELKSLKAIQILAEEFRDKLTIVPTFMGAHATPPEYKGRVDEYVSLICDEMIPAVAAQPGLAAYCDVFCEEGYFSTAQARRVLQAGVAHGMAPRLHADEFVDSGAAALAAEMGAHSADHLMAVSSEGASAMARAGVVATVLPGTTVFLGKGHSVAPMRALADAGCRVAVATDNNPGSSVHQSMPQMMQLCVSHGGLSVGEAFAAATCNPATALRAGLDGTVVGAIKPGARADLLVWALDSLDQIPYYGAEARHRIDSVVKNGRVFQAPGQTVSPLTAMYAATRTKRGSLSAPSGSGQGAGVRAFSTTTTTQWTAKQQRQMQKQRLQTIYASPRELRHILGDYVGISAQGQIERLPDGVQDIALAKLDENVPHAPKRLIGALTAEECNQAVCNHLRYFAPSLHAQVRPVLEAELEKYGHIYCYFLIPPQHLWAAPFEELPRNATPEARCMIHMILNNLDPAVAQFPQELITYGGNGACFSNWAQFYITVNFLCKMGQDQTLSMHSGHPAGLWPASARTAPKVVITNGMMIPHYSTPEHLDRLYALGVSMYGQMTAGSWMYIGPQGIVHGTTLTVASAITLQERAQKIHVDNVNNGKKSKVFITSGLGGMSGAQPKAGSISGVVTLVAEVSPAALYKRHEQGWLDEVFTEIPVLLARAYEAQEAGECVSLGLLGNVVDLWEALAEMGADDASYGTVPRVHIGSDQTSCHNPFNGGYYPVGVSFDDSNALMVSDPDAFKDAVQESLRRQLAAIQTLRERDGLLFFDYGNAFLLECHRAKCQVDDSIPSYVECIMGPEYFDYGFGPYRWVCTSGDPADLAVTDQLAEDVLSEQLADVAVNANVLPQLESNLRWIREAGQNQLVVGSQARILYADTIGRIECAVRMNKAVAEGRLSAPVVVGRDHHDVSGTDAPWRETANIRDGSNITADMSMQNVIGDAARGATWVSIHNGGGTGWGMANNGGFGLVLDGSPEAEACAREMIFFDVTNGLVRRARAGNENARKTVAQLSENPAFPAFSPFYGADV
jgi:urocanate hydratase